MRVLQVVALLTPDGAYGGPARVALNQCSELANRGHEVTLAAGTRGYQNPPTEINGFALQLFSARTLLPRGGFAGIVAPGLLRWVLAHCDEFDVVHIHFARDLLVLPAAGIVRRKRVPYVLQTHGMVISSRHPLAGPLDAVWTRRILTDAAGVLYLTELECGQLREVARTRVRLVRLPNGVPNYPPRITTCDDLEVLFLGRLDARKRPTLFVMMAKRLLAQGLDVRFTLVGPDEGEGAAVKAAIGDESRISWEGPLDPAEVPRRMAAATVYVLPSEREPYPMSVLEAMAVGLPVVVCDDCGLAAMIAQTGSGIVSAGTVESLADAASAILADPARFGKRARETALANFGMEDIATRLEVIYQRTQPEV